MKHRFRVSICAVSPEARDGLTKALHDEDWEVRVYASEALKRLDPASRKN